MIWSTTILNFIKENNIPIGFFTQTPYWKFDETIRKSSIEFQYTDEEIDNINKIKDNIFNLIPFINVKLRGFQEELLNKFRDNRFNLIVKSRQCGINTVNAISILHYILTNTNKNVVVLTNKTQNGIGIIDIIKNLYNTLPFYMKVGVETWNQTSIRFDNGVTLRLVSNLNAMGINIDYLLMDEAAHIINFDSMYRNVYPQISAIKDSKITICSTPNGINGFYHIYNDALLKRNSYTLTKIYWNEVEGRDEQWKKETILSIGSLNHFEQEYELKFHGEVVQTDNKILNQIDDIIIELKNNINIKSVKKLNKLVKELKKIAK